MKNLNFGCNTEEALPPIFSLNVAFTGSQLTVDANQLNALISAGAECDVLAEERLVEIQKELQNTYKKVTSLFEDILFSMFGSDAVIKNEIQSVSESTIFFIGGEDDED